MWQLFWALGIMCKKYISTTIYIAGKHGRMDNSMIFIKMKGKVEYGAPVCDRKFRKRENRMAL